MSDLSSEMGIVLGLMGVIALAIVSVLRQRKSPELSNVVTVLISVYTADQGVDLCLISMEPSVTTMLGNLQTYVFLAGIVVIWVSMDIICGLFAKAWRKTHSMAESA